MICVACGGGVITGEYHGNKGGGPADHWGIKNITRKGGNGVFDTGAMFF